MENACFLALVAAAQSRPSGWISQVLNRLLRSRTSGLLPASLRHAPSLENLRIFHNAVLPESSQAVASTPLSHHGLHG